MSVSGSVSVWVSDSFGDSYISHLRALRACFIGLEFWMNIVKVIPVAASFDTQFPILKPTSIFDSGFGIWVMPATPFIHRQLMMGRKWGFHFQWYYTSRPHPGPRSRPHQGPYSHPHPGPCSHSHQGPHSRPHQGWVIIANLDDLAPVPTFHWI